MRVAPPILLTDEQQRELLAVAGSRSVSVRFAQRPFYCSFSHSLWPARRRRQNHASTALKCAPRL